MNIQEYIDNEIAKGNTDIHIPDGLESCNTLEFPAGVSVAFPWMAVKKDAGLRHLNAIEKAFPGKDCSIEYRKNQKELLFRTYDITIRVDNCAARRSFDKSEFEMSKISEDEWMTYEIERMIRNVRIEFEKLKGNKVTI